VRNHAVECIASRCRERRRGAASWGAAEGNGGSSVAYRAADARRLFFPQEALVRRSIIGRVSRDADRRDPTRVADGRVMCRGSSCGTFRIWLITPVTHRDISRAVVAAYRRNWGLELSLSTHADPCDRGAMCSTVSVVTVSTKDAARRCRAFHAPNECPPPGQQPGERGCVTD
jgi:hypothetical protein